MKIHQYPSKEASRRLEAIVDRAVSFTKKDEAVVTRILADVKKGKDAALLRYINRFDAPDLKIDAIAVTEKERKAAEGKVDAAFLSAMNKAADRIEAFHKKQVRHSWIDDSRPGALLGQMMRPVEGAGIYVPGATGGETPLVSTVLMCAIPARIAGVSKLVMSTPPKRDGSVDPHLLAAANRAGVDAVYKAGSAWGVAALAFGTETVPRVDVIAGPGNKWVTIAKKLVSGTVGIDMIAGPSEILIIADETAPGDWIAADMLSQAEHDPLSSPVLVATDRKVARQTAKFLEDRLAGLKREETARASLSRFGAIFLVDGLDAAFELANRIAPEHLELMVKNPFEHLSRINNAGAVFVGPHTPEPVGDYIAGTNHVLPTAGTARFSSALSVDVFMKKISLVHYGKDAFEEDAHDILRLADVEGLDAHAGSIRARLEEGKGKGGKKKK